ncbi:unnamed protein product [Closterium sp. NIES-65]|nr:unnamed protein product [Closterium sp. NIES-65]
MESEKRQCHLRCADRLQAMCFKNGGIYIKLGQHIAQLDYIVPEEYVIVMKESMLNTCPVTPYEDVRLVIQSELGKPPEEIFSSFDPTPVASASLAQVHRGTLKTGEDVAVKVQHAHLLDTAAADMVSVRLVISALYWFFPSLDYRWLITEVEESLPKELNFTLEASNGRHCMANFRSSPSKLLRESVAVPRSFPEFTGQRVLTMEWMEGVPLTDVARLKDMGINPADVAKLISTAFAEMIFRHGFVHCDPHAANVLVRPKQGGRRMPGGQLNQNSYCWITGYAASCPTPSASITLYHAICPTASFPLPPSYVEPEVVLLDHGLCRQLPDSFCLYHAISRYMSHCIVPTPAKLCGARGGTAGSRAMPPAARLLLPLSRYITLYVPLHRSHSRQAMWSQRWYCWITGYAASCPTPSASITLYHAICPSASFPLPPSYVEPEVVLLDHGLCRQLPDSFCLYHAISRYMSHCIVPTPAKLCGARGGTAGSRAMPPAARLLLPLSRYITLYVPLHRSHSRQAMWSQRWYCWITGYAASCPTPSASITLYHAICPSASFPLSPSYVEPEVVLLDHGLCRQLPDSFCLYHAISRYMSHCIVPTPAKLCGARGGTAGSRAMPPAARLLLPLSRYITLYVPLHRSHSRQAMWSQRWYCWITGYAASCPTPSASITLYHAICPTASFPLPPSYVEPEVVLLDHGLCRQLPDSFCLYHAISRYMSLCIVPTPAKLCGARGGTAGSRAMPPAARLLLPLSRYITLYVPLHRSHSRQAMWSQRWYCWITGYAASCPTPSASITLYHAICPSASFPLSPSYVEPEVVLLDHGLCRQLPDSFCLYHAISRYMSLCIVPTLAKLCGARGGTAGSRAMPPAARLLLPLSRYITLYVPLHRSHSRQAMWSQRWYCWITGYAASCPTPSASITLYHAICPTASFPLPPSYVEPEVVLLDHGLCRQLPDSFCLYHAISRYMSHCIVPTPAKLCGARGGTAGSRAMPPAARLLLPLSRYITLYVPLHRSHSRQAMWSQRWYCWITGYAASCPTPSASITLYHAICPSASFPLPPSYVEPEVVLLDHGLCRQLPDSFCLYHAISRYMSLCIVPTPAKLCGARGGTAGSRAMPPAARLLLPLSRYITLYVPLHRSHSRQAMWSQRWYCWITGYAASCPTPSASITLYHAICPSASFPLSPSYVEPEVVLLDNGLCRQLPDSFCLYHAISRYMSLCIVPTPAKLCGARGEVVLLDHGLCRQLPDSLCLNYAHLWKALVLANPRGNMQYSIALGTGLRHVLKTLLPLPSPPSLCHSLTSPLSSHSVPSLQATWNQKSCYSITGCTGNSLTPSASTTLYVRSASFPLSPGYVEPEVVLLDHGLYRQLPDSLRLNYAHLWKALVLADARGIMQYSIALGAGADLYAIFAATLTLRSWENIVEASSDHLFIPDTAEEKKHLQVREGWGVGGVGLVRLLMMGSGSQGFMQYSIALGAGADLYAIFAATLTLRSWENIVEASSDHLFIRDTAEEKQHLQVRG